MGDKFKNILRSYKRFRMKNMIPEFSKYGIIEEDFDDMRPYLEKAYKLGKLDAPQEVSE